jgi:hypothetical protein
MNEQQPTPIRFKVDQEAMQAVGRKFRHVALNIGKPIMDTRESLDSLPEGSIIKDVNDEPWKKRGGDWYDMNKVVRDSKSLLPAYGRVTVLWVPAGITAV